MAFAEVHAGIIADGDAHFGQRPEEFDGSLEREAFPENTASLWVMAKLGLRYRETRLVTDAPTGAARPVCVWQLERAQWVGG